MGAIASGGVRVLNADVIDAYGVSGSDVDAVVRREQRELERREQRYREGRPFPDLRGKTVVLVDDGLATGSTMRAAVEALRQEGPARVVVGVPIAAPETCEELRGEVDDIVCALTPETFLAVGYWYDEFEQTTDEEVQALLAAGGAPAS